MDLKTLAKAKPNLSTVPHVGWKYLWKGTRNYASVEVIRSLGRRRHFATMRSSGLANMRLIRAIELAKKSPGKTPYTIRLLSVPPLVYSAIWLKSRRHRTDKVVVVETIVQQIRPFKIYGMHEFLELLRGEAAMLLDHSRNIKAIEAT